MLCRHMLCAAWCAACCVLRALCHVALCSVYYVLWHCVMRVLRTALRVRALSFLFAHGGFNLPGDQRRNDVQ